MNYAYLVVVNASDEFFANEPNIEVFESKDDAYQYALEQVKMFKQEGYEEEFSDESDDWWHMESEGSKIDVWFLERKVK